MMASHACTQRLGLTLEQLLGRRDDDLFPPATVATFAEEDPPRAGGRIDHQPRSKIRAAAWARARISPPKPCARCGRQHHRPVCCGPRHQRAQAPKPSCAPPRRKWRLRGEQRWKVALDAAGTACGTGTIRTGCLHMSVSMCRLAGLDPEQVSTIEGWLQRIAS